MPKNLRKFALPLVAAAALAGSASVAKADAATYSSVDLTSSGTNGASQVTAGATSALPIFGTMVAVGAVVMGFRRLS